MGVVSRLPQRLRVALRWLLIALAGGAAVASFIVILSAARVPNYDRRVRAASGIETEMPNRVLLLTNQPNQVNRLRVTLSDKASFTDYYADGVAGESVWFLLFGDARLTDVAGIEGETESGVPGLRVEYQLVSAKVSSGAETGYAIIRGSPPTRPSVGASRWEFAAPTLDVSCDARDRELLRSIAATESSLSADIADACRDKRANELTVTVLVEGDERIETDAGPLRPPGTDQRQFTTRRASEQRGFEFGVTSASDATHATTTAAVAGIVLGGALSFLVQTAYDALSKSTHESATARFSSPAPRPGSANKPSVLGITLLILYAFKERNR